MTKLDEIAKQLQDIVARFQIYEERQNLYEEEMRNLKEYTMNNQLNKPTEESEDDKSEENNSVNEEIYKDDDESIAPDIPSGDQIQLESYKAIPEFSGAKGTYRPWRNQVVRRMRIIEKFKKHPKYEAALAIVRAKIVGNASNVLTNNKTHYNIESIIKTLDASYSDQRPLYAVEAEMTSLKQWNKTLEEYYDAINQALNVVISKITFAYKGGCEQEVLVKEAQKKAVRTFIMGLKSCTTRNILYGRIPGTLAEAFSIAQTVRYDSDYMQLDCREDNKKRMPKQPFTKNINYITQQQAKKPDTKNEQKDKNGQTHFKRPNWSYNQNNNYNATRQPTQQQGKINNITDGNPEPGYETPEEEDIPEDLISNSSDTSDEGTTSSAFLGE